MTGQPTSRSSKQLREAATLALKEGRLHPDHWAEVDDLLLDEQPEEATELLTQHVTPKPAYPTLPCLGHGSSPMPDQQMAGGRSA